VQRGPATRLDSPWTLEHARVSDRHHPAASRLSVDDILGLQSVSDAQLHPGGQLIAYVVGANVTDAHQSQARSRVWLAGGDHDPRQLTADETRAHAPRWSPSGRMLAFLGARDIGGKDQVFLLDGTWGEARKLTDCAGGVIDHAWTADGNIILLTPDGPPHDEEERKKAGRDEHVFESQHHFGRLWRCEIPSGTLTQITHDDVHIWEFTLTPDGMAAAAVVSDEPYEWDWYAARLVNIDLRDGRISPLRARNKQITLPAWSPDAAQLIVISCTWSDRGMSGGDVILLERDGSNEVNITEGHPRSYIVAEWEQDGSRLLCYAIEGGEAVVGYLSLDGGFEPLWNAQAALGRWSGRAFSRSRDGSRIAAVRSTVSDPSDVWTFDLATREWQRKTTTNPEITTRQMGTTETLHWNAPDGTRVQGLLLRPADYEDGPLPLVTLIHGGPTSLWEYSFPGVRSMAWAPLLAAEGYAVLLPNPRGSMGWGTAFAEANVGDMGGGDLADVLAGVEYCVTQGIANPERLGVAGWSYGGYLTPWAITQTTRFKAAVSGASITNWVSFHGASHIPGFDATFCQVDPFNWDGRYGQFSPMAHVRRVQTPTLFLHGERDTVCPVGQAYEMFRALKELGVDTELVVYPREGHGIREREHARDVLERAIGWFKRYV
jgi:dipeptidyl aminopeptidase/acylaminoacyl peptidase